MEDCWTKDKASGNYRKGNKRVNFRGSKNGSNSQESNSMFSKEQFHALCQSIASTVGAGSSKKRKGQDGFQQGSKLPYNVETK